MKNERCADQRIRRSLVSFTALLLCLPLLAGCGQVEVPAALKTATLDLLEHPSELGQAEEIFQVECARSKGYDVPLTFSTSGGAAVFVDIGGIFDSKEQALSGYGSATVNEENSGIDAITEFEMSLAPNEEATFEEEVTGNLDGTPDTTACATLGTNWIYGSEEIYSKIVNTPNDYMRSVSSTIGDDSDLLRAVTDDYSPCMVKAGYELTGLSGYRYAQEKFGRYRRWDAPPSAEEQAMAVQDYECQQKAKVKELAEVAFERVGGQWMVSNEAMLLERHEQLNAAKERAQQIISGDFTYEDYLAQKAN